MTVTPKQARKEQSYKANIERPLQVNRAEIDLQWLPKIKHNYIVKFSADPLSNA